jgi:putative RNA 2'-phosphotransferase
MEDEDVRRSRRISRVLRHRPEDAGLTLDAHGWVTVSALLAGLSRTGQAITREDLARVVENNDKRRFEWDRVGDRIRARQGHSVDVDLGLETSTPPDVLYHGTTWAVVSSIMREGLLRGRRHHVHLSPDAETAERVGARRRGGHVVLTIDAGDMARAGHTFYVTSNGVWLTTTVPPAFIAVPS